MLKRSINWQFVSEWVWILSFCIIYSLLANVQSRLFPAQGSIAVRVRKEVNFELNRLDEKHNCEDQALQLYFNKSNLIIIWYENKQDNEYWCGLIDPDKITETRIKELMPYITVLNSDKGIRRIVNESNKRISNGRYVQ